MLEKLNRMNILFDIYGVLLTARQRQVLCFYFSDDLSLGEIAAGYGVSRQAVYDLLRRAVGALEELEQKLGLFALFDYQRERLEEAERILAVPVFSAREQQRLKEIILELSLKNEQ